MQKYKPWGEVRQATGELPTDYTFTGQREHTTIEMLWYNSRFYDLNLGRFSQADSLVPYPDFPLSFDRYNYVRNNPLNRIDPTGHMDICPDCGGGGDIDDEEKLRLIRLARADALEENGWDLVPIVSDVRSIIRGNQNAQWASQQQGYYEQQVALQNWYNNCYGVCHGASAIPGLPLGGPMPDVPLVDMYSQGVGETASGVTNLAIWAGYTKFTTQPFYHSKDSPSGWHLGLETKNNMSIIHVGISPEYGKHIAFGSVKPFVADFHIYIQKAFPFFRTWRPPR